jgi:hypothetical protein
LSIETAEEVAQSLIQAESGGQLPTLPNFEGNLQGNAEKEKENNPTAGPEAGNNQDNLPGSEEDIGNDPATKANTGANDNQEDLPGCEEKRENDPGDADLDAYHDEDNLSGSQDNLPGSQEENKTTLMPTLKSILTKTMYHSAKRKR